MNSLIDSSITKTRRKLINKKKQVVSVEPKETEKNRFRTIVDRLLQAVFLLILLLSFFFSRMHTWLI